MIQELIRNFSFEDNLGAPPSSGFVSEGKFLQDWHVLPDSADIEIAYSPYPPRSMDQIHTIDGRVFVDSQASPGGIDIAQTFRAPSNGVMGSDKLQLQVAAALQNVNGIKTDPNDHLLVSIDGQVVQDIGVASFRTSPMGPIDFNHFQVFSSVVSVSPGPHTIELHDVGPAVNVGIGIDFVSVHALAGGGMAV